MNGLKRRAHDSSRAMDGEARFSLARIIRAHTLYPLRLGSGPRSYRASSASRVRRVVDSQLGAVAAILAC